MKIFLGLILCLTFQGIFLESSFALVDSNVLEFLENRLNQWPELYLPNFKLSDELYEAVCKATKLIPQRAIMGANFLNFRAHEIYTINGNKIDETFVKWDDEKNKCFAGFVVSGNNVGVDETVKVSGEALSFLSTGIDTRVYFIKNF